MMLRLVLAVLFFEELVVGWWLSHVVVLDGRVFTVPGATGEDDGLLSVWKRVLLS
jgi:hypothetical protein